MTPLWHQPKTWKPGDVRLTAPILNYELRDQLLHLYDEVAAGSGGTPEAWQPITTWLFSWGNSAVPGDAPGEYYKHAERVYLRGVIVGGIIGTQAFELPVGYRPVYRCKFLVRTDINNGSATVTIETDGKATCDDTANSGWVDLAPISFRTT